ncbi:hypothetical protein M758_12G084900 [Ceratodon purpureus]|nr:hypothetical protein M758_12G084900 [Ceratodon purpureus]
MELMNSRLWGSLVHGILQLIFAWLSMRHVRVLKCLSKSWKNVVTRLEVP